MAMRLVVAVLLCASVLSVRAAPATYAESQLARATTAYYGNCAICHGIPLDGGPGGPALTGAAFRARWQGGNAAALFDFIRAKMPPDNPGDLPDASYADLIALILKHNGVPAGETALTPDAGTLAALAFAPLFAADAGGAEQAAVRDASRPVADAVALAAAQRLQARMQRLRPVSNAMLEQPADGDWLHFRRSYDAHGFSPLAQINRRNARDLTLAWSWTLHKGGNEITPLVHDGVMFVANNGRVQALDAASGDFIWQYVYPGRGGITRNLAILGERLYFAANDGHMVALDMRTGTPLWNRAVRGARLFSAGPLVARGMLIQGASGCDAKAACFVVGLDAETGEEKWRFDTVARPGTAGGDSWGGLPADRRFGGSVWITPSYDPALNLVYVGVGQTYHPTGLLRGASGDTDALYTDTTLALRPDTGELVWHYQHMQRDVWDLDWSFERTLAPLVIDGKSRLTVTTAGKPGIFDTLDAATGAYLYSFDPGLQNLVSAIDPLTGRKTIAPGLEPVANVPQRICPGGTGARGWPSTAYNPRTGILYAPMAESCMQFRWLADGEAYQIDSLPKETMQADGNVGHLAAIDLSGHRTLWSVRRRAQESSAVLATAGGLVFEGSRDRWFRASDDRTGKELWRMRLNGAPSAFPVSYAVGGVQYVAITTGGGAPYDSSLGALTPEIMTPALGSTLWVFRVPARH